MQSPRSGAVYVAIMQRYTMFTPAKVWGSAPQIIALSRFAQDTTSTVGMA